MSDRQMVAFRLSKSGMTYKEIGHTFGVSGARARQLAMSAEGRFKRAFAELEDVTNRLDRVGPDCDILLGMDLTWTAGKFGLPDELKLRHYYSFAT